MRVLFVVDRSSLASANVVMIPALPGMVLSEAMRLYPLWVVSRRPLPVPR